MVKMNFQKKASFYNKQIKSLGLNFKREAGRRSYSKIELTEMENIVRGGILDFATRQPTGENQRLQITIPLQGLVSILQDDDFKSSTDLVIETSETEAMTLSDKNINNLEKGIMDRNIVETELTGSDQEVILRILKSPQNLNLAIRPKHKRLLRPANVGGFFKYTHNLDYDLSKYGIYKKIDKKNYVDNCLIKALRHYDIPEFKIQSLKSKINDRYFPLCKMKKISEILGRFITVRKITVDNNSVLRFSPVPKLNKHQTPERKEEIKAIEQNFMNLNEPVLELCLYQEHYFVYEKTDLTRFSLNNYNEIKNEPEWNKIVESYINKKGIVLYKRNYANKFRLKSNLLFKLLMKNKDSLLNPIKNTKEIHSTQYHNQITEIGDLTPCKSDLKKCVKTYNKNFKGEDYILAFFDFESITNKVIEHIPFIIQVRFNRVRNGTITFIKEMTFRGVECGKDFINYIDNWSTFDNNFLLMAHNAMYDFSFIKNYLRNENIMKSGNMLKQVKSKTLNTNKNVIIRDTYSIISDKLENFGEMFNLNQEKEVMPYSIYTEKSVEKKSTTYSIKKALKSLCNNKDKKQFNTNIKKWNLVSGKEFNHIKYAEIYCKIDVEVLEKGYISFRNSIFKICDTLNIDNIDILDMISIAQTSFLMTYLTGCYEGCYELSGVVREFIQQSIIGGRVMTRDNKKWHTKIPLGDFDGVSLYPSAMARIDGYLMGKPKVIMNGTIPEKADGYFVEIEILDVKKKLHFPIVTYKDKDGNRVYSNDFRGKVVVDKTTLEDWIKFQKIEFEIIRGYYFDEGRNDTVNKIITNLFQKRLEEKKKGNPIQKVYKLLMNSAYGKLGQKPINEKIDFRYGIDGEAYIHNHYNSIRDYQKNGEAYIFRTHKAINSHYNMAHLNSEVLSMSKRIMNEVMCLAEDLKILMYYTDTDSIHIDNDKIALLALKYKKLYNKELIGKSMGQFHCDFDVGQDKGTKPFAVESYFVGKKSYIDKVECIIDSKKEYKYHIRMKGVPTKCIEEHKLGIWGVYEKAFETFDCIEFDLTKTCNFECKSDFTMANKQLFTRALSFRSIIGQ